MTSGEHMADNPLAQWLAEQEQRVTAGPPGAPEAGAVAAGRRGLGGRGRGARRDLVGEAGASASSSTAIDHGQRPLPRDRADGDGGAAAASDGRPDDGGAAGTGASQRWDGWHGVEMDDGPRRRGPSRRLLIAALLPWVVAGGLALAVAAERGEPDAAGGPDQVADGDAATGPAATGPAVTNGSRRPGAADGEGPPGVADGTGASGVGADGEGVRRVGPGPAPPGAADRALVDLAVLEFRAAFGPVPSADPAAQPAARFVDDAVATGIQRVGDGAVVTVRALVLEGDAEGWRSAGASSWAIALRSGPGGPALAAGPWPVPAAAAPPSADDGTDPALAAPASRALERAGYRRLQDVQVVRDPALPGVAVTRATALAPGEAQPRDHVVWVDDQPSHRLLGHSPAPEADTSPPGDASAAPPPGGR